ncbi:hypothetical protein V6N11_056523 [Hibiscus sabdariffa]|uniref:Aspartate aminotransferase n=1 Tax=Hibiscus sabdariffa TaxID=183260 RepID=A0ABR2T4A8_9ROSI
MRHEFTSSSSPADRRLNALFRHLATASTESRTAVAFSPTSGFHGDSVFSHVVRAPEDPILGVTVAYNKDPSPVKLNLGVGAYRTEEGKPLVLSVVRKAEQMLLNDRSRVKEYLPIVGIADFNKLSAKLIFGADSPAIRENRVTTVQCLSGTGSLRVGAEFMARHYHQKTIYIPQPTWGNHPKIFTLAGLSVKTYRYYDPTTRGLNFQGLLEDLGSAPSGSIVLLHACAHNPTGVDPTLQQWEQIRQLMRSKALLPFFDSAYQGFASGNLDQDAQSIRMFVADGGECFVAQSYAKNMGLYGERVGALSVVCKTADVASRVESQLKLVIRPMFSNPPIHGASIVATILKDSNMFNEWTIELKAMADRIISMREQLFDALRTRGTPGDWSHIIKQIGMFTFTGLNSKQVEFMTREYHIYMTSDGRISMAGLSSKTVPHLADAIHAAVTRMRDHSSHSGSKRHRPAILPLPREGSCRCSVKPASRCAFLSRDQETQAFAQDSWPNSWLGTGRPKSRPHAPDSSLHLATNTAQYWFASEYKEISLPSKYQSSLPLTCRNQATGLPWVKNCFSVMVEIKLCVPVKWRQRNVEFTFIALEIWHLCLLKICLALVKSLGMPSTFMLDMKTSLVDSDGKTVFYADHHWQRKELVDGQGQAVFPKDYIFLKLLYFDFLLDP